MTTDPAACNGTALERTTLTEFEKPAVAFIPSVYNGLMHLGHLRTYLANWVYAKKLGWRLLVFMEGNVGNTHNEAEWMKDFHDLGLEPDAYILDQRRGHVAPFTVAGGTEPLCPFVMPRACSAEVYACTCALDPSTVYYSSDPCSFSHRPWPESGYARIRGEDGDIRNAIVGVIYGEEIRWLGAAWMRYQLHQYGVRLMVRGRDLFQHTHYQDFVARAFGWPAIDTRYAGLVTDHAGKKLSKSDGARPLREMAHEYGWLDVNDKVPFAGQNIGEDVVL